MRNLRTQREINEMRKAGLLVWQAHQLAVPMLRPGVTTAEIDAAIADFFAHQGATPLFRNYPNPDGDGPPFPAVTCISINEQVVHGIPGPRKLREGDIVSIDTGCSLGGWCGDAAATFVVGAVAPEVRRLLEVTKAVLQLAIDLLRTSRRWSQVASEMDTYVRRAKFSTVVKYVGHGIGREMHEDPQVPNYVDRKILRKGDFPLEPGLVLAIEPMVNMGSSQVKRLSDTWTVVTADGKPSAHFEHTVALTGNGPCVLTAGPHGESW